MKDKEFEFFFKIFLVPLFVSYLFAVDYLFFCGLYREAITLLFLIFSVNALAQRNYIVKYTKGEFELL